MFKKVLAHGVAYGSMALMPLTALAAINPGSTPPTGTPNLSKVDSLLTQVYNILNNTVLPGILVLALIFFMWGVAMFILGSADPEKRQQGKHIMTWGIVALFVIVAVWGIVYWLANLFGVNIGTTVVPPRVG